MEEQKDVYIKDEGEFATICFQSDKAKKLVKNDANVKDHLRIGNAIGGGESVKLDVDIQSVPDLEIWLVSNDLSWESEL
jgi:hypothetical protein